MAARHSQLALWLPIVWRHWRVREASAIRRRASRLLHLRLHQRSVCSAWALDAGVVALAAEAARHVHAVGQAPQLAHLAGLVEKVWR